ncbi:MAG: 3-oxoacyl-ACP synthase III family protein [Lachnospiraceae bacterium]|nr:3-oxoacyl-ACP synthase III family protein [Lachnospiraceae bacterium]
MENNAVIKGVAYYHPENMVDNDYFIEYFKKQGKNIEGLLKATGRKNRYVSSNEEETILTMGYHASVEVINKTHIKASQINLIVFSSGTPEYIAPTNAMKLHSMLNAGQKCAVYDLNVNCAGMVVALEQVSRIMRNNQNIKYALIVGADQLSRYARYDEAIAYANFADSACAMLIENIFHTDRGFVDSDFYTNSSNHDKILMPAKGMSSVARDKNMPTKEKLVQYGQFDFDGAFHSAQISIEDVLFRNDLKKKDIKKYFFSQFSWKYLERVCEEMEEDILKFKFVGDEFGYTGTTSPMLAYAKSLEAEELEMGDYVVFWTVGAGTTCPTVLYKY